MLAEGVQLMSVAQNATLINSERIAPLSIIDSHEINELPYSLNRILCDYHLVTRLSDIVTIFPIPKANFSTVTLLPCDYLLVYILDIGTILSWSLGSHNISDKDCSQHSCGHILHVKSCRAHDQGY